MNRARGDNILTGRLLSYAADSLSSHRRSRAGGEERDCFDLFLFQLLTPKFWLLSGGTAREDSRPTKS